MSRKVRMGMVGGGRGAFIGAVHRMAAALDGHVELVCGAFSGDPDKSRASGADLYLPADRVYGTYREMMEREAALPAGERMDFVSIVTPNNVHFPVAKAALEAGFHVISDKPMTYDLDEALALRDLVRDTGLQFGLTHNYTGYPMVMRRGGWSATAPSAGCGRWWSSIRRDGCPGWRRRPGRSRPAGAPIRRRPASAPASATSAPMPRT